VPSLGEVAQTITAIAVLISAVQSYKNGRTLKQVHMTTNSLAQRNEAIARELGVKEGQQQATEAKGNL
jgi:hypothetical protein